MLQIKELKSRLEEEQTESDGSVKEEITVRDESEEKVRERSNPPAPVETTSIPESECKELNYECLNGVLGGGGGAARSLIPADFKDGASDSDSSAILNEDNSPNGAVSSCGALQNGHHHHLLMSPASSSLQFNCSSSSSPSSTINCFQFQKTYHPQYVKMEEHNFFSAEEACNFFSEEQAPTLQWYSSDHWS